jgi:hypothetical protein
MFITVATLREPVSCADNPRLMAQLERREPILPCAQHDVIEVMLTNISQYGITSDSVSLLFRFGSTPDRRWQHRHIRPLFFRELCR